MIRRPPRSTQGVSSAASDVYKRQGSISHRPAHIIDLLPTAIAASAANYDGELTLPGRDLIADLNSGQLESSEKARTLFFEHQGNRALRQGKWKLVALDDQSWELYDFTNDRIEANDLATKHPDLVQQLSGQWDQWAAENHVTPLPRDLRVKYLKPD